MTKHYHKLHIKAKNLKTEIWLGDLQGSLVQHEIGEMDTKILKGEYVVSFGIKEPTYKINLENNQTLTEEEIIKLPVHPKPSYKLANRIQI